MSYVVVNPNTDAVKKEINMWIGKYLEYLKSIDTDVRIVKDDYGTVVALVPRFHIRFKDASDLIYELSTSTGDNRAVR